MNTGQSVRCGVKAFTEKQKQELGAFTQRQGLIAPGSPWPAVLVTAALGPGKPMVPSSASPNLCCIPQVPVLSELAPSIAAELKPLLSFVSTKVKEESSSFKCQEENFHPLGQDDFEQ